MKIQVIVYSSLFAAVAALAVTAGSAQAVGCVSPFITTWSAVGRCPAPNQNIGSSQGIGTPQTSTARVRARLDFAVAGGQPDTAEAIGATNLNQISGTAACAQGVGAPGCLLCRVTDTDPSSANFEDSPASGACTKAVKHELNLHF